LTALVLAVVLAPLLGALAVAARCRSRGAGVALIVGSLGSFGAALALAVRIAGHSYQAWAGFLYVDSLSVFFALTISLVVILAAFGSAAYLRAEEDQGALSSFQARLYFVFFALFASGMLASVFAGNLGLLWVLIEASTLASAALVGLEARPSSLEAA
jgi:hydrogenase-4 component F